MAHGGESGIRGRTQFVDVAEKEVEELDAQPRAGGDADAGQEGFDQDRPVVAAHGQPVALVLGGRHRIGQQRVEERSPEAGYGQD